MIYFISDLHLNHANIIKYFVNQVKKMFACLSNLSEEVVNSFFFLNMRLCKLGITHNCIHGSTDIMRHIE